MRVQITMENQSFHSLVTELVVSKGCCNEKRWKALDLSFVTNLERLEVGDECFDHLEEIRMVGLKHLQEVKIGEKCACSDKTRRKANPNSRFIVNDCVALKELDIGACSFPDYVVCSIQNVPSLEMIRIGSVEDRSYNFMFSSLELKSGALSVESCIDLPKLATVEIGKYAFYQCVTVLFESCCLYDASRIDMPELTSIQCGDSSFYFLWDDPSSQLVLRSTIPYPESCLDLPKLATLTTTGEYSNTFSNPVHICFESTSSLQESAVDMPNLHRVVLSRNAFYNKNNVVVTGSASLVSLSPIDIGAMYKFVD